MKMVAAAKLARAQLALLNARPYSDRLKEMISNIISRHPGDLLHPLLTQREVIKNAMVLVFTANRGLCGSFNTNILRTAEQFLNELRQNKTQVELSVIGKKGNVFLHDHGYDIAAAHNDWADGLDFVHAQAVVQQATTRFLAGEIDAVFFVYSHFNSAVSQHPTVERLLPFDLSTITLKYCVDFLYEPSRQVVLDNLIPRHLATRLHAAHLEARASELGARTSAMESATINAADMISRLTLSYNRARQSSITRELMDIVNGAEALRQ